MCDIRRSGRHRRASVMRLRRAHPKASSAGRPCTIYAFYLKCTVTGLATLRRCQLAFFLYLFMLRFCTFFFLVIPNLQWVYELPYNESNTHILTHGHVCLPFLYCVPGQNRLWFNSTTPPSGRNSRKRKNNNRKSVTSYVVPLWPPTNTSRLGGRKYRSCGF